jgi:hypothetical protein
VEKRKDGDQKAYSEKGDLFSSFDIDDPAEHGTDENGRDAVDPHDQSDPGFGGAHLFEKQRKNEKQGDTHKKEKKSHQSHKKLSVPHDFLVSHFSPTDFRSQQKKPER